MHKWNNHGHNIYDFKSKKATGPNGIPIKIMKLAGADPAFVIRDGPNSEHFLSNLKKLLKRGKFFRNIQSLIVKRNWVYIKQFVKTCFL